ncbi:MAG: hypothetical protein ABUS79_17925, partial [Pseudomonadota bacterium]
RMGGDLLYDVPKKPARPTEQGMVYIGHVAHTKAGDAAVDEPSPDADDEPGAQGGPDRSSPIEPIAPAPPAPPADASTRG